MNKNFNTTSFMKIFTFSFVNKIQKLQYFYKYEYFSITVWSSYSNQGSNGLVTIICCYYYFFN